ncbi:hypothetical protein HYV86_05695 [Candidatus Woesearchaeota archaeon]|nr:hypothetical protein [Candidatus Woesearchaeota archaeon]
MSDKESRNHVITIIAIVALVAIVAVVMFGFNKTEFSSAPAEEESAIAGEAINFKQLQQLGANQKQQRFDFLAGETLTNHYGNTAYQQTKSGNQICQDMGYSGCFAVQLISDQIYYESSDLSCSGNQFHTMHKSLDHCNIVGNSNPSACESNTNPQFSRTDYKSQLRVANVICRN